MTKEWFEKMGFKQLLGAPDGVLTDLWLEWWPTYAGQISPGRFLLHNPQGGVAEIPRELQPKNRRQALLLMCLLQDIKDNNQ